MNSIPENNQNPNLPKDFFPNEPKASSWDKLKNSLTSFKNEIFGLFGYKISSAFKTEVASLTDDVMKSILANINPTSPVENKVIKILKGKIQATLTNKMTKSVQKMAKELGISRSEVSFKEAANEALSQDKPNELFFQTNVREVIKEGYTKEERNKKIEDQQKLSALHQKLEVIKKQAYEISLYQEELEMIKDNLAYYKELTKNDTPESIDRENVALQEERIQQLTDILAKNEKNINSGEDATNLNSIARELEQLPPGIKGLKEIKETLAELLAPQLEKRSKLLLAIYSDIKISEAKLEGIEGQYSEAKKEKETLAKLIKTFVEAQYHRDASAFKKEHGDLKRDIERMIKEYDLEIR